MNIETIDKLFQEVIRKKGVHHKVGKSLSSILQLRYRHKKAGNITLETKLSILQRAGVRLENIRWTDADMVAFLTFYKKNSQSAKEFGPAYILERFKLSRR